MRQAAVRLLLSHRGLLREPPRASSLTFLCQTHALSALSPSTCQASTHTDARTKAQPHAQINVQSPTNQLDFGDGSWVFRHKTARELLRGLLVLHACAVDPLVTHSYKLMKMGERLLGSSLLGLLMSPFYSQFVAGDSEAELGRVSRSLADVGVRLMVAPMLETDLGEGVDEQEMYRRNLDKTLMLVAQTRRQSVMGGARPVCQTKMTAHLTADVLKRVSEAYQSLTLEGKTEAVRELGQLMVKEATKEEGEAGGKKREAGREEWPHPSTSSVSSSSSSLQGLLRSLPLQESDAHRLLCCLPRLHQLGETCRREDVVLAVDAEYTYTNPAINLMTLAMMHVFNRQEKRGGGGGGRGRGPIVWNTYQGYLKAGVENLQEDLAVARALGEDMSFGVKLVRGAYLERERAWAAEQGRPDPVNDTYEDTCDVYNRMVEVMLAEVDAAENASGGGEGAEGGQVSRAVMVATHNEESVVLATQKATRLGLDTRGGSVVFAQVYGMAENISVPLDMEPAVGPDNFTSKSHVVDEEGEVIVISEDRVVDDTYRVDGFEIHDFVKQKDCVTFRTNVKSEEVFERWKNAFFLKNNVCFNSFKMFSVGKMKLFRQQLMCHHGKETHAGIKKTYTGCKVFMDATIRLVHARSPEDIRSFPCFMKITGQHNHPLDTADVLNQLRVSRCTREMFENYFRQGMAPGQAYRHHLLKMELDEDLYNQAKKSINPSPKSVEYMWSTWKKKEHGGLNAPSMFDAIKTYAEKNPDLIIKIHNEGNQFAVVLVTPFMMRAHKLLQEAGEVVFVDATSCVDQVNRAVIPLLCSGPAGAVPLAVLFTSSQDEATLTKGFGMVKEAIGEDGFFGQGGPQNFMTDNCNAERNALAAIWPNSKQYLCIFHVLQQVWRWLLDSKHGINKNDRQELMSAVKLLLHAESIDRFEDQLEKVQHHPLLQKYPNFKSYLNTLDQRREEWAIAYRAGALLRGHNTNNYCESTMCIIKDNVLNRCKAYNTAQLVMFMAEIFNSFMKQRIVDVALNRRHTKRMNVTKLPLESVVPLGSGLYRVGSETNPGQMYEVDLNIGICTCTKGNTGAVCKHQAVCADSANLTVPQMPMLNSNTRHQLAVLALGQKDAPSENFFKTLKEIKSDEASKSNIEAAVKFGKSEEACELNFEVKGDAEEISPSCSMETASVSSQTSSDHGGSSSLADNIHDETNIAVAELLKTSKKFGNEDSVSALKMFVQRLRSVKTSNQFNSFLHTVGVGVCVQKGAKRPRNLAENVRNNVANAKSHGSGH